VHVSSQIRNALENDGFLVCAAAVGGGLTYYVLEPLFPKVDHDEMVVKVRCVTCSVTGGVRKCDKIRVEI
jgi:hypothetical protein